MPRAVDPNLGRDGYAGEPVGNWKLAAAQVRPLLVFLDQTSIDAAKLAQVVWRIGADYRRRANRGADAFTRAEACAALDAVLDRREITAHEVFSLNERAFSAVHDQLLMMANIWVEGDSPIEMLCNNQIATDTLRVACHAARNTLAALKGADRNEALHICAD